MAACAPCVNSRQPRPLARRQGSAPTRIALPLAFLLAFALACSQCSSIPPDERAARSAAERWLEAMAFRDSSTAARTGVGRCPGPAFRGASILRVEPVRRLTSGALDSLAAAAEREERRSAAAFAAASEETAESLWVRAAEAGRRAQVARDARRAAAASSGSPGTLRTCRIRARMRWGGPLVGPTPVDREHVVRVLAAPGGPWIVFSWLARDRDPPGTPP